MPAKKEDLPGTIERSPKKVQDTDEKTLDSAHERDDSEARAPHRKSKQELYDDAEEAAIEGRSEMSKHELAEALQKHSARESARARR